VVDDSRRWRWIQVLFLCLFGLHCWRLAFKRIELNDEGMILYSSIRILDGSTPYRDVYVHTMGGSFCLQATACALIGRTVVAHRVVAWLAHMVAAALALALGTRLLGPRNGTIAGSIGAMSALPYCHLGHYTQWSLACILGAFVLDARARASGRARTAAFAGLCLAAAFWFKPNTGLYAAVALIAFHLALLATGGGRTSLRLLGGIVAGGLLGGGVICAGPLACGTFGWMWEENFARETVARFTRTYSAAMPSLQSLFFVPRSVKSAYSLYEGWLCWLPILASALAIGTLAVRRIRRAWNDDDTTLLLLALLTIAILGSAYPRADREHFGPALLPGSLVIVQLLRLWASRGPSWVRTVLVSGLLALFATLVAEQFIVFRGNDWELDGAAKGIYVREGQARQIARLKEWTTKYAPPGSPILVVPDSSLLYMILDRPDALTFGPAFFQAVLMRGAPAVLADLEMHPPALVLDRVPPTFIPDSETWLRQIGFRAWLEARYRLVDEQEGFRAWVPR